MAKPVSEWPREQTLEQMGSVFREGRRVTHPVMVCRICKPSVIREGYGSLGNVWKGKKPDGKPLHLLRSGSFRCDPEAHAAYYAQFREPDARAKEAMR